jgi:hypothetical protein
VCSEPHKSVPRSHPISLKFILTLSSHLHLNLRSGLFLPSFPTKTLSAPLFCPFALHDAPVSFLVISSHFVGRTDHKGLCVLTPVVCGPLRALTSLNTDVHYSLFTAFCRRHLLTFISRRSFSTSSNQRWRLALSKGPNRIGVLPLHSPEDGSRASFRNVVNFNF